MIKHYILYIPGLGDGYDHYRQKALRLWSLFGVQAQLLPMKWYGDEAYDKKYVRASRIINDIAQQGHRITLVGESAGGSMAINLFADHPSVDSLITIAGVNKGSTPIASRTLQRGPAFADSRQGIGASLDRIDDERRRAIHTVSAWWDPVVRAQYSQVAGATNHRVWSVGHLTTVALCLTLFSGYVIFLAKQSTSV